MWTVGLGLPHDGKTCIDYASPLPVLPIVSWNVGRFAISPLGTGVRLYDSSIPRAGVAEVTRTAERRRAGAPVPAPPIGGPGR